jgi:hypothetical protein
MLRFHDREDFVEVDLINQETSELPSKGDAYLTIRVSSEGFTGHNDLWVLSSVFSSFCRTLVELENSRKGEAVLESISPGELRLVVRSLNSRGHMVVEGYTGYNVQRENLSIRHSVQFGFEFDPSQLLTQSGWTGSKRTPNKAQQIGARLLRLHQSHPSCSSHPLWSLRRDTRVLREAFSD